MDNFMHTLKPLTYALIFFASATTIAAEAEGGATDNATSGANDNTPYVAPTETSVNTDWMSPTAAEFVKLDKTGNGLLLPYEASKDKAFNKKTFSKADTNKDGYIDELEYTQFKTGKLPDEQASNISIEQGQSAPN